MDGFEVREILLLLAVAVAAGWVDAVVGGGGLIQLPALLLVPGVPPAAALGTNKLSSIAGTTSAAVTYLRRTSVDRGVAVPAALTAVCTAGVGAATASMLPVGVFRPLVIVLLLAVAVFVALRPSFGTLVEQKREASTGRRLAAVLVAGVVIGFYDGIFGPGTGTFLIVTFTALVYSDFLHSSAMAKLVNAGTNFGALVVFAAAGQVMWRVGLGMAVCNIVGARLGARMALRRGAKFVRVVLLIVVVGMVIRLALD